ncbi:tetratricopeptide repeat protein [Parasphingopyxis marina]|uniref:Tetratricopeptide repeat protein n=1 Tax=Parasphingopyxis marina TaxID=2761622 RepID=A0A842HW75_9SPHN|nr:hypothetical protein [Parasphingopyxis marina]MBC2777366.1 hypothetical protein [Parasphingopyxis marina]
MTAQPAELKVRIYIVENDAAVRRYFDAPSGVAGFYRGAVDGAIAVTPMRDVGSGYNRMTTTNILFHEYAHHFMLQYFPTAYPAWYIEGFAEYFATVEFLEDGSVRLGSPPEFRASSLRYGTWIRADRMLSNESENDHMTYAEGWLLVHLAANNAEVGAALSDYLNRLVRGETGREAYENSFGQSRRTVNRMMQRYLSRNRFSVSSYLLDPLPEDAVSITPMSDEEAAIALLAPRQPGHLEAAVRRAVEYYPNNPQAHVELARDIFHEGDFDGALARVEHALAIDPDNIDANILKGDILIVMARATENPEDPRWEESRTFIARANNAAPNNPSALASYFASFPDRNERPAIAVAALERAFNLVPQNDDIRFLLATEYVEQGRLDDAVRIATPLAQNPHGTGYTEPAQAILAQARAGDAETIPEAEASESGS